MIFVQKTGLSYRLPTVWQKILKSNQQSWSSDYWHASMTLQANFSNVNKSTRLSSASMLGCLEPVPPNVKVLGGFRLELVCDALKSAPLPPVLKCLSMSLGSH